MKEITERKCSKEVEREQSEMIKRQWNKKLKRESRVRKFKSKKSNYENRKTRWREKVS